MNFWHEVVIVRELIVPLTEWLDLVQPRYCKGKCSNKAYSPETIL